MTTPKHPTERGFWHLTALQFQGAFSDNVFKMVLILYVSVLAGSNATQQMIYSGVIAGLFPLTYLIFSCWAGFLADKFSKRSITISTKVAEVAIMVLGCAVFIAAARLDGPSVSIFWAGCLVLFLMFTQSAFFSPTKYGIIPELVRPERLSWANGVIGLTTYLAIILGLTLATFLFGLLGLTHLYWMNMILVALAGVGFVAGLGITKTPRANPGRSVDLNFLPELMRYFKILKNKPVLAKTVLGLAYFWALGSLLLAHFPAWGKASLGLSDINAGYLYLVLSLGIGVGSAFAGALSGDRIEPGLITLGGIGIGLFTLPLSWAAPDMLWIMCTCIFLLGFSSGCFTVPLNALLQSQTELKDRGGLIAASNYITCVAMLGSTAIYLLLVKLGASPNGILLGVSLVTLLGTIVILKMLPQALLRFLNFLLTHAIYRMHILGIHHLPKDGPALLVSNHVSYIDALLVMAASPRPVRFVAWSGLFEKPLVGFFLRVMKAIPIDSSQRPREMIRSLRAASGALADGEVLCLFAEGQITRTGRLLPFRKGYQYILKEVPAPVIPLFLDKVWGSIFSFERNRFFWKMPRRIPYNVRVAFGKPCPPDIKPAQLRQTIEELGAEAAIAGKAQSEPLHHRFIRSARGHWRQFAMNDMITTDVTLGQTLWRSIILARRLAPYWQDQKTVGIMLPPSVGGALVNFAASLSGRATVNLNYTAGQQTIEQCARQADLKTVVTARRFLDKTKLESPTEPIWIEEQQGFRSLMEVVGAILVARLLPVRWVEKYCRAVTRPDSDSLATIVFSSGSTGEPKGVMLSHFNVLSNLESFQQGIHIWPHDRFLGILPFFHSFGYTVTLWTPVIFPCGVVYHVNPLDIKIIGEICQKRAISAIITTPTFLQHYMRRLKPEHFTTLNTVVVGAEHLPESLREAFLEKFGIDALQGFGTTECSPVVSVNVDDFRSPGLYQIGHKHGSIGHPLPGIAARIIHAETGQPLPSGEAGLLLIKGPNVMQGYLGLPEKTAEVLRDGWYNTGDMATIDTDGFIFITGRLSRFSKIGGEMVPHVAIEDKIREALTLTEGEMAIVTAVPDAAKGERLVLLHNINEDRIDPIGERLTKAGLPNLWIPRREMCFAIDEIPILGTGKLDLRAVKRIAEEKTTGA